MKMPDNITSVRLASNIGQQLLIGGILILLSIFAAWPAISDEQITGVFPIQFLALLELVAWAWTAWSWKLLTGRYFDPYSLLLFMLFLFNGGGSAIALIFSGWDGTEFLNQRDYAIYLAFSIQNITLGLFLVIVTLIACHMGAIFSILYESSYESIENDLLLNRRVKNIGILFILVSAVPALLTIIDATKKVAVGGYMALYQDPLGATKDDYNYFTMLSSGLVPGALYLLATERHNRFVRWLAWILILSFSLAFLLLGTRAAAYQNTIALLWLHHNCVKPIKKVYYLILAPVAAIIATVVGAARSDANSSIMGLDSFRKAFSSAGTGIPHFLMEMGNSIITVVYSVQLVPSVRQPEYGLGYFYSILSAVPNLFWKTHPTVAHGTEGDWLIKVVSPETAAAGGALGFSLIAEAYVNFWWGAPIVFAIFGFLLGKFSHWTFKGNQPYRFAVAAAVISIVLFASRGESQTFARRVIWIVLIPYLIISIKNTSTVAVNWARK
jgi:oligosaccharide repeat unit polymerase